jgi:hypothetical protein
MTARSGRSRRFAAAAVLAALAALGPFPASALAATPEEPLMLAVTTFTGTTATFEGEPNPNAVETAGYEFLYVPGNTVCQGTITPAGPEVSRPAGTKVSEPVVGLEGSTEYTVCMDASITEGGVTEKAASNTVTFKTLPEKPLVILEQSNRESPFEATVEAQVNPENQPTTSCVFEYSRGAEPAKTAVCKQPLGGSGLEIASAKLSGLSPGGTYSYHVIIKNATGKEEGKVEHFTTEPVPPSVISESVSRITEGYATLEAQINPGGEASYYAEYGTSPCGATACGTRSSEGFLLGDTQEEASLELTNLKPNTTYHYWVVATNSAAPAGVHGEAQEFTTPKSFEEIRNQEDEQLFKQRAQEEAKTKAEAEARAAAAAKEHQEEEAAAAAKKRQQEQVSASKASVTIINVKVGSNSVVVTLDVSQAGRVTISGRGLKTTTKKVAAGTMKIKVALTKAGKSARKHHKKIKITVELKSAGKTVSTSKTVKL